MPRFQFDCELDEIVADAMDMVWESLDQALLAQFISTIEIPTATEMAMQRIYKMVAWSTCQHDGVLPMKGLPLELLSPDEEPVPVSIDPWARGTVLTKKLQPSASETLYHHEDRDQTPSVGSRSRRGSKTSGIGAPSIRSDNRSAHARTRTAGQHPDQDSNVGLIWNLDEDNEGEFDNLNSTGALFNQLQKSKLKKHQDPEASVEERGEFDLLEASIRSASKELKSYAVDKNGNVIPIEPMKPEKLPPFALDVQLKVSSISAPSPNSLKVNAEAAAGPGGKKKKVVRVAGSRAIDDNLFKAATSLSTSLASGEYITAINPGVVLRVDDKVLTGPPIPEDATKLSRQQYLDRSMTQSLSGDSLASAGSAKSQKGRSGKGGGSMDSGPVREAQLPLSMRFPDVDPLAGARKVQGPDPVLLMQQKMAEDMQPGHTASPVAHASLGSKQAVSGSGIAPKKPNEKQVESVELLTGGVDKMHPRNRDNPLSMVPVAERKRLPAPPPGKTMGHGLGSTVATSPTQSRTALGTDTSIASINSQPSMQSLRGSRPTGGR